MCLRVLATRIGPSGDDDRICFFKGNQARNDQVNFGDLLKHGKLLF